MQCEQLVEAIRWEAVQLRATIYVGGEMVPVVVAVDECPSCNMGSPGWMGLGCMGSFVCNSSPDLQAVAVHPYRYACASQGVAWPEGSGVLGWKLYRCANRQAQHQVPSMVQLNWQPGEPGLPPSGSLASICEVHHTY